mmetsp:Transcript_17817/g.38961  ORF Transcript_17817/g.38961 Transcript_17817/m.38961 type:complete len:140 (-) Transcript_17817:6-425(-)
MYFSVSFSAMKCNVLDLENAPSGSKSRETREVPLSFLARYKRQVNAIFIMHFSVSFSAVKWNVLDLENAPSGSKSRESRESRDSRTPSPCRCRRSANTILTALLLQLNCWTQRYAHRNQLTPKNSARTKQKSKNKNFSL